MRPSKFNKFTYGYWVNSNWLLAPFRPNGSAEISEQKFPNADAEKTLYPKRKSSLKKRVRLRDLTLNIANLPLKRNFSDSILNSLAASAVKELSPHKFDSSPNLGINSNKDNVMRSYGSIPKSEKHITFSPIREFGPTSHYRSISRDSLVKASCEYHEEEHSFTLEDAGFIEEDYIMPICRPIIISKKKVRIQAASDRYYKNAIEIFEELRAERFALEAQNNIPEELVKNPVILSTVDTLVNLADSTENNSVFASYDQRQSRSEILQKDISLLDLNTNEITDQEYKDMIMDFNSLNESYIGENNDMFYPEYVPEMETATSFDIVVGSLLNTLDAAEIIVNSLKSVLSWGFH